MSHGVPAGETGRAAREGHERNRTSWIAPLLALAVLLVPAIVTDSSSELAVELIGDWMKG